MAESLQQDFQLMKRFSQPNSLQIRRVPAWNGRRKLGNDKSFSALKTNKRKTSRQYPFAVHGAEGSCRCRSRDGTVPPPPPSAALETRAFLRRRAGTPAVPLSPSQGLPLPRSSADRSVALRRWAVKVLRSVLSRRRAKGPGTGGCGGTGAAPVRQGMWRRAFSSSSVSANGLLEKYEQVARGRLCWRGDGKRERGRD